MFFDMIRDLCYQLEEFTFEHADEFCDEFCVYRGGRKEAELIHLRFSSGTVEFVYLTYSGQHVVNGITWERYIEWVKTKIPL